MIHSFYDAFWPGTGGFNFFTKLIKSKKSDENVFSTVLLMPISIGYFDDRLASTDYTER